MRNNDSGTSLQRTSSYKTEEHREYCNMEKDVRVSFQPSLLIYALYAQLRKSPSNSFTSSMDYFFFSGPLPKIIHHFVNIIVFHIVFYQHETSLSSSFVVLSPIISMFSKLFTFTFGRNKQRRISTLHLFLRTPLLSQQEVQLKKLRGGREQKLAVKLPW